MDVSKKYVKTYPMHEKVIYYLLFLLLTIETFLCPLFFAIEPAPCQQGLDLGILIDCSSSIRDANHKRLLKDFFPKFFKGFKIAKRKTNVGIITYDIAAGLRAPFNGRNSRSRTKITNFVKGLHRGVSLGTRTDKGLKVAHDELFTKGNGDRKSHQNVLLCFTDGRAWPKRRIKPFSETVPPLTVSGFYFLRYLPRSQALLGSSLRDDPLPASAHEFTVVACLLSMVGESS